MKLSLALFSFSLLVGCATPTSIKVAGDQKITVHTLDKVNLPKADVLDQDGKPMPDQVITWDVAPPEVAALTADKKGVEPKADGDATVTAKSGTLSSKITLTVALPDDITVGGITDGGTIAKDATATLTGSVTAKGEAVDGQTVTFTSSDPNIAKVDGMTLTAVAEGPVTITAKSGDLTKDVKLTVGTAAPAGAAADAGKDAKAPAGKDATKAPAGK